MQEEEEDELTEEQQHEIDVENSDICWLMNTIEGRRIVWRILADSGVFGSAFDVEHSVMAFKEGGRNQGLKILALIDRACPHLFLEMLQEKGKIS